MQSPLEVTEYLSDFVNVPLGKQIESMDTSPQFQPYSGVEITVNEEESIFVGNRTGRVLEISNPWGTREQAQAILDSLNRTGFQYQPYSVSGALLNPAAELGDGVTINGLYSGIYKIYRNYDALMSANIEAPQDEEVDHEYPFEPQQDRVYKREIGEAKAQIKINQESIEAEVLRASSAEGTLSSRITQTANSITAEVTRATNAEGTLSSRISQNATSISAKVSQTGGNNSSFGWSLLSNKFSLYAGSKEVFKCTSSGVEINGKITATSGFIGNGSSGFTITASSMYNGMGNINSGANGVYIGTNGIALGGGKFKVTSSGAVSAVDMTLSGTLNIGGSTISASTLRSGAQSAYSNGGYWSGGAAGGYKFNNATNSSSGSYPDYFRANQIACTHIGGTTATFSSLVARDSFYLGSTRALHLVPKASATYVVGY